MNPPPPPRVVPRATYRLQLHRGFGFPEATRALPYLVALGVSHVYCSPYLRATSGSTHGYDVVDPTSLNPDLGSDEDYVAFCRAVRGHGLEQLLDIVPNHMGVESPDNAWWQDVLRFGPASAYAGFFDIDWQGNDDVAAGRLLLPVLAAPLADVIARGELTLRSQPGGGFRLVHLERSLPVNAAGTALIFARAAGATDVAVADALDAALSDRTVIAAVADRQHYQLAPWQLAATAVNYRRFFDVTGLAALRIELPAVFESTHRTVIELIRNGLVAGLRIDHPDGLRDPGAYFTRLQQAIAEGDAPDGARLYVVAEKILAPHEELPAHWPVDGTTGYDFANLVCGVLLDSRTAPAIDAIWRGFTGERSPRFADLARAAKKEVLAASFGAEWRALSRRFCSLLAQHPSAEQSPDPQDPGLGLAADVIAEVIGCFPVYRTYPGADPSEADRRAVRAACDDARDRLSLGHRPMLDALAGILTAGTGAGGQVTDRDEFIIRFQQLTAPVMAKGVEDTALYRWSRLVSVNDVGADPDIHGVDVATFHAANRRRAERWPHALLATSTHDNKRGEYVRMRIDVLSEDPAAWQALSAGWRREAERLMDAAGMAVRPAAGDLFLLFQTLVGTVPADLLSTAGDKAVESKAVGSKAAGNTAAGQWPEPAVETLSDYVGRIKAYLHKAGREAKRLTSWTEPDDDYEQAVARLVDLIFGDESLTRRIVSDVRPYAWFGALNSLSLTALKLTVPGVPDIYQGANILDDSLVDPDNRRPVDFDERLPVIRELAALAGSPHDRIVAQVTGWLRAGDFARLKLWTIHRLLRHRTEEPELFSRGDYLPIPVTGSRSGHLIAFARRGRRRGILVVASRLYRSLDFPDDQAMRGGAAAPAGAVWRDETLDLRALGAVTGPLADLLTRSATGRGGPGARGASAHPSEPGSSEPGSSESGLTDRGPAEPGPSTSLRVSEVLQHLPVAILRFDLLPETANTP